MPINQRAAERSSPLEVGAQSVTAIRAWGSNRGIGWHEEYPEMHNAAPKSVRRRESTNSGVQGFSN